ncbi:MAG: DUF4123 domain-containing protein [Nannocystis sp.]|nr:immunity protein Tsi6 family protein [Nannocystis sp.]MBA3544994.1 DUF4123 domain-containing protein [Nannocystis sp.]
MTDTMRIVSRDAFAEVLAEAVAHTAQLSAIGHPAAASIAAQLEHMARTTARGRVPADDERTGINLGPLAVRNFEQTDPEFADSLAELDYTFRRYPLLPEGAPIRRRGILQVWSGGDSFHKIILDPGLVRTVGTGNADFVVNPDPGGSPHFQIVWDGVVATVLSQGNHVMTVQGLAAWMGELANGGWMTAEATTFRFFVEDRTPQPKPVAPERLREAALAELRPRRDAGTLYAVLDAARSGRVVTLLAESVDPYASLYDGEQGRAYDDIAPYLVKLRRDSALLERLIAEGWTDAWGLYIASGADFDAVRRHLRNFLRVEVEGDPRRLLFRYYDPRVLRDFLGLSTPEQRAALLAGQDAIVFEYEDGSVGILRRDKHGRAVMQ